MLGDNMPRGATHCARLENDEGFSWLWARITETQTLIWNGCSWQSDTEGFKITETKPLNAWMVSK